MSKRDIQTILVTGAAGFIGAYVCERLLQDGYKIIGVDNMNAYYPVGLKQLRLKPLNKFENAFAFHKLDIADHEALCAVPGIMDVDCVIHLAAQAGVRYSIENPFAYAKANLVGHLSILEFVRHAPKKPRLVYASSSSVYGANTKVPFCETDPVTQPVSLYAATKRSDEMMSEAYSKLYNMEQIGLRFFTVYGPKGRPDMAYWSFAERILSGKPIHIFNHGNMERDFTYIDDIVTGVIATALEPMKKAKGSVKKDRDACHKIYNIGNNKPVKLMRFVEILEQSLGMEAEKIFEPMQSGDVHATYANIDAISADYGFVPSTTLEVGIPKFVKWFLNYRQ